MRFCKFHTQMHIFVALRFCIRFQNHRHTQPVALGKGNVQHLAHIALPLILVPHTDKSNENVGFLFLVHAVLQGSFSPLDSDTKPQKALQGGVAQHSAGNGPHRLESRLLLRQLIGDIALTLLAGSVQKAAPHHPAHISTDIVCSGFFPGKGSGHSRFLSVVIIAEGMADITDGFLV